MLEKDCEDVKELLEAELLRITSMAYFRHLDIKIEIEKCIYGEYQILII